jgi:anti-sigma B factor antagonist
LAASEPEDRTLQRGDLRIELDASGARVFGALDMEGAPLLEEQLIALLEGARSSVVVDLRGLEFVDSTGLQALMRASVYAREHGLELRFMRGSGQVDEVMRLTRVGDLLPLID